MRDRDERLSALAIQYRQIVVPEKSTVMRHLLPGIHGPTPVMTRLDHALQGSSFYVDGLKPFEGWSSDEEPWQKPDSHCTPAGTCALLRALLEALPGHDYTLADVIFRTPELHVGDLGKRIFDLELWASQMRPAPGTMGVGEASARLIDSHDPDQGHTGLRRVWQNSLAPIDKTVVVFGNS